MISKNTNVLTACEHNIISESHILLVLREDNLQITSAFKSVIDKHVGRIENSRSRGKT
jgi:hypothetical protein